MDGFLEVNTVGTKNETLLCSSYLSSPSQVSAMSRVKNLKLGNSSTGIRAFYKHATFKNRKMLQII